MPEVEHVIPVANQGPELDWDNFLLACKYCNVNKLDHNKDRTSYIWPDQDNTFRALEYKFGFPIQPAHHLNTSEVSQELL
jgi:5-methylcytosine-specific restriction endonuclease McrA